MKTAIKVSIKIQRIIGTLSRIPIQNVNHLQGHFCGEDHLQFFLAERCSTVPVTPVRIYRKYQISMHFLRSIIFHFPSKGKISCFREKKHLSRQNKKDHIYSKKLIPIKGILIDDISNIIYQDVFYRNHFLLFMLKLSDGKGLNIIFQCDFFERLSFQNI